MGSGTRKVQEKRGGWANHKTEDKGSTDQNGIDHRSTGLTRGDFPIEQEAKEIRKSVTTNQDGGFPEGVVGRGRLFLAGKRDKKKMCGGREEICRLG